ncbi:MAG: helicase-exonuclease AddAB subunit AddA [Firmicutes bacterium]|nr:helicase-exonuclease AddAB subunit AddA [Bacillota bacterium]
MQWSPKQYEAISERGKNLLVSAAAGSGKTAVLVERIKGLLLNDGIQLTEMLIVTFSNAAASEMREKIAAALQTEMEKEDCSDEKRRFLRGQLNSMHKANISTFHAFAMEVIRRYFYLIGAEPSFRICDEGQKSILQDQAMEQLFQQEFKEKRPEFLRFLDWYATGKSEQDVKDMIYYVHNFIQSMPRPFEWLKQAVKDLNAGEEQFCGSAAWKYREEQRMQELELARAYFRRVYDRVEEEGLETLLPKAKSDLDAVEQSEGPVKFAVFTAGKADKEAYALVKDEITALRDRGKELWNQVQKQYGTGSLEDQIRAMNDTAWAAEELYGLTKKFDAFYREKKEEKGLLDFSDIEHYALEILKNPEAAKEYRAQFRCIFIDEYQDSNVIQEELISCIARQDNVFMVGDVKQSIYKFRLAEPEIFLNKYEDYRTGKVKDSKKIDLNLNFRCKGSIIDTTNQIFEAVMTKQSTGITYDEDAALHKGLEYEGELDYPSLLHIVDVKSGAEDADPQIAELATAEVEALQAARLVKESLGKPVYDCKRQVIRPLRKRDVVILLRGVKSYGDLYAKALMEQGIESFMDNSDGYFGTLEIRIFLNLLRIVDNKRQDVALLSVLRSPVFRFTISELAEIRANHKEGSYFDALEAAAAHGEAVEEASGRDPLAQKCAACLKRLALWREKASFMPLADFLQLLISETGYGSYIGAIAGGTQRLANVNAMVDKAIQYEASSGKGLFGFIRYIEALQKGKVKTGQVKMIGENDDVVRIMTIHKSKGLEFPFVLIGGLGRAFNKRKETAKVACHKDLGLGLRRVIPEHHAYQKTMIKQLIDQKLVQDDMAEEIRILYVGFTRAQDRLMLLASVKNADRFREQKTLRLPEDSLGAGCYLDMIFPWTGGTSMEIRYSDRSLLSAQKKEEDLRRDDVLEGVMTGWKDEACDPELMREISRRLEYRYEDSGRNQLKTKYTVSELAAESEKEEDWREAFHQRPAFMEVKDLTAADRGTIYHRVMECLPFDRKWTAAEIRDFIGDMVKRELISAEEAKLILPGKISAFFRSPLGKRLVASTKKQKEISFNLKKERDGHSITVQGTIDCYFSEKDGIVLVDYKSNFMDNRREEEEIQRLVRRYRPQLLMYQEALEAISGQRVKQMYLYLFSAGKAVEILPQTERNDKNEEK